MNAALITDLTLKAPLPTAFRLLFHMWAGIPKAPDLPLFSNFHLDLVPPELLPWSVVVDVISAPKDFRFRFWGTERANLIGIEMTGQYLTDIEDDEMREGNRLEYEEILTRANPVLCQTPVVTSSGRSISILSIRLPLSTDGKTVSHIYSAVDPQSITAKHYEHFGTEPRKAF